MNLVGFHLNICRFFQFLYSSVKEIVKEPKSIFVWMAHDILFLFFAYISPWLVEEMSEMSSIEDSAWLKEMLKVGTSERQEELQIAAGYCRCWIVHVVLFECQPTKVNGVPSSRPKVIENSRRDVRAPSFPSHLALYNLIYIIIPWAGLCWQFRSSLFCAFLLCPRFPHCQVPYPLHVPMFDKP